MLSFSILKLGPWNKVTVYHFFWGGAGLLALMPHFSAMLLHASTEIVVVKLTKDEGI